MGDPVSSGIALVGGGLTDLISGKAKKPPPPPAIPQRQDPDVQARLREERRKENRLRGRASLILSQPSTVGATGAGSKELLGG